MAAKPRTVGSIRRVADNPGRMTAPREMWRVDSSDGKRTYTVALDTPSGGDPNFSHPWSCTCPAYEHHGGKPCKHINAVIVVVDAEEMGEG